MTKINTNVPGLRSSSRPCAGVCTVHFVYNTSYLPHRPVLGPVLFTLYTTLVTCLIEKRSIRHEMFANDTQLNHSESSENY